jgi:hypothetical protein
MKCCICSCGARARNCSSGSGLRALGYEEDWVKVLMGTQGIVACGLDDEAEDSVKVLTGIESWVDMVCDSDAEEKAVVRRIGGVCIEYDGSRVFVLNVEGCSI